MNNFKTHTFLLTILIFGCNQKEDLLFKNPSSDKTGLKFSNVISETNDLNILDYLYYYNGGGISVGDINNDGLPDIFLSGNQVKNKLFLNKGDLEFEDISEKAKIQGNSSWNTGAVMGDVNGDGLLDIYVCAVVGLNGFNGFNELYINNGDETFTESAAKYQLDHESYSSSSAFLDYDLDGDLDLYLLNHAIHTPESFGKADLRFKRNYQTGDKLLRNDNGVFTDVSEEAGIYGGVNGYGLGIAISDFNQDGFPDIFVGNDFHEDDYYYINNTDGTFSEKLKDYFGHTSRFSMGNDVADINHDGWPDIISLDMLPEDETVLKSSEGDDNIQVQKLRTEKYGYHYQFTRNMLFVNQQNANYLETALMSGVAATDWSWSALFADYNQDGEQDLFISNGIPKRPNNLDFIKFASNDQIQKKIDNTKLVDQQALNMMPSGRTHNVIFKGSESLMFEDMSGQWMEKDNFVSGATAISDLDNDGDLDVIVNNLNDEVALYVNQTNNKANYLKIKFNYNKPNAFGIGTKVYAYNNGKLQYKELYTVRGFQASSEPTIHFGLGTSQKVDSIKVVWPNKTYQILKDVQVNQTLNISPENTKPFNYETLNNTPKSLFKLTDKTGVDFVHEEDNFIDFNRQKLIPYQVSDRGPALAIGDLNGDGKDDIYFGSSRYKPSKIFFQSDSIYVEQRINDIAKDSINEDVTAVISDFNKDGRNDLLVGTGGAHFSNKMKPLLDTYYKQTLEGFENETLPEFYENASIIKTADFDNDGDLDVFIGSNTISNDFGNIPDSYLLKNDNGNFSVVQNDVFEKIGMITDAVWEDFNNDGNIDLILVGEWMSPKFLKNNNGNFVEENVLNSKLNGLWQQITPFDMDGDGDTDYLLGNWGNNSKFKASKEHAMKMYYADFDGNGSTESIVCTFKNGKYYPLLGLDELAGQIVSLKKKFTTYKDFAGKSIEEIFDKETLKKAVILEVDELKSGYLKNDNSKFTFIPFKNELQVSPITAFVKYDFDADGKEDVLAGGNYFGVTPFHGRFDSFPGALIKSENEILLGNSLGLDFSEKSIRHLNIITLKGKPHLLVTINNYKAQVYELTN
ncbi:VCBS repeat-containing protein [Flaviramulus sp. BrNp1-15]|uniref:VCBS repeat-containing protein n=1 Tax=Flaviramulus sp. BrNp1-15 TaxID=2916754 RepID=UPI001EE842E1|nr:VCBS repeat-containing protein [Flaviramulus sp. BrNp1-15]ULC59058.1 VCBS repeat-containing protein [Flaviramulus sp. BrNp1-15]